MTQPFDPSQPPPYGWTPPPSPRPGPPTPPGSGRSSGGRTADQVLSWLLWTASIVLSLVFGVIAIFLVFEQDGCGVNDVQVCQDDEFWGWLLAYWGVMLAAVVGACVGLIVASVKDAFLWPWAVGGAAICTVSTFVFYGVATS